MTRARSTAIGRLLSITVAVSLAGSMPTLTLTGGAAGGVAPGAGGVTWVAPTAGTRIRQRVARRTARIRNRNARLRQSVGTEWLQKKSEVVGEF